MVMHLLVLAVCVSIVVLFLGCKQEAARDAYAIAAITLITILAAIFVCFLGTTDLFPLASFYIAILLVVHHAVIHRATDFTEERCASALFQCKDVGNHETWVVAAVTATVVSFFHV